MTFSKNSLFAIPFVFAGLSAFSISVFADSYEIVRGKQYPLCRDFEKNLNEFTNSPPMVCERKFSSKYKGFTRPDWQLLPADTFVQAALAIERAGLNPNGPGFLEVFERRAKEIRDAANSGRVKAWEAHFDLARSGKRQRVVMAVRGICEGWKEEWEDAGEPHIGVVVEGGFEIDRTFARFSTLHADVFFYQGLPYLASWQSRPTATGREKPPPKRHRAYVFAWDTFWNPPSAEGPNFSGFGGYKGPVCQIGYQRMRAPASGGSSGRNTEPRHSGQ